MITINETQLIDLLRNTDKFVSNVGLTYTKAPEMNKYLDFKENGKANPNPYFDSVTATYVMSNLQTGFEYEADRKSVV